MSAFPPFNPSLRPLPPGVMRRTDKSPQESPYFCINSKGQAVAVMPGDCVVPEPDGIHYRTRKPSNAQHEPPYAGDSTVVFSMRSPGMTAHIPTKLCLIEEPHSIAECREWNA